MKKNKQVVRVESEGVVIENDHPKTTDGYEYMNKLKEEVRTHMLKIGFRKEFVEEMEIAQSTSAKNYGRYFVKYGSGYSTRFLAFSDEIISDWVNPRSFQGVIRSLNIDEERSKAISDYLEGKEKDDYNLLVIDLRKIPHVFDFKKRKNLGKLSELIGE